MKIMQGACFLAFSNMSRTRAAPTPTNISTKSEPEMLKKGTLASPAMALASKVLPVPGGPTSSTPRGMRPPRRWNLVGSRRKSTSSVTSSLASSQPATSEKVMLLVFSSIMRARDLPKLKAPPLPPPCIWRMKKIHTPMSSSMGNHEMNRLVRKEGSSRALPETSTPALTSSGTIQRSPGEVRLYGRPESGVTYRVSPWMSTLLILPACASDMNWVYVTDSVDATRPSNCLKTVKSTSAITIHMATLENELFKANLLRNLDLTHRPAFLAADQELE